METPFDQLLHILAPRSLTFLVGSHLHGTAGPESDEDRLTIYHDPLDLLRPFPYFPDVRHGPGGDHKLYRLSEFVRLLAKGNPNSVEVLYAESDEPGEADTPEQATIRRVLRALEPHAAHRGFYGAALGHATQVLRQTRAYSDGSVEALSREEAKRVAHAIRVARYALSFAEPGWGVGLSEADVALLRDVKFGRLSRVAALDELASAVLKLEWTHREHPAAQTPHFPLVHVANALLTGQA